MIEKMTRQPLGGDSTSLARHLFLCACAAFLLGFCQQTAAGAGETLTIASKGVSDYVIVVPDEDERDRAKQAAQLLRSQLKEATGVELPLVAESKAPAGKPCFFLGRTAAATARKMPLEKLKEWTHLRRVDGRDIFLIGNDVSCNITERPSAEYLGTYKAVTAFLHDEVGVRFLLPGPNGIHTPKLDELKVDAALDKIVTPRIQYCHDGGSIENPYAIAHNYVPLGYYKTYGGHSYYTAVPIAEYAESHPEYYVLSGGKRVPKFGDQGYQKNHLCISNPEVQELMMKEMEKQFDKGYEWVQLSQTDGYRECECDKCMALGPDAGERLWIVHRKLAEELMKRRPGKKVVILSYAPTASPPKTFEAFPENVIIETCTYKAEHFEAWKKFKCEKLAYIYNWGKYQMLGFLPKRTPDFSAAQLRLFAANEVNGIYMCGFGETLGLEGPNYYVYGRLLQNPDADPRALADEFYISAYGKAAAPMKTMFDEMNKRLELYSHIPRWPNPNNKISWAYSMMMPQQPEDMVTYFFPPKLVSMMEDNLKRAFTLDNDPKVQARLRLVQREFTYLKNLVSIFNYYHAYKLSNSWAVFDLLESELKKRGALIDSWYVKNERAETDPKAHKWTMKIEDGWPKFFDNVDKDFLMKGGRATGALSVPFTWDMENMRKRKLTSSTAQNNKQVLIHRFPKGVAVDGDVEKGAWRSIKAESLQEINMGKLQNQTTFKVAYDDTNLYLTFTCVLNNADVQKFGTVGKDGAAWSQECIEIFLCASESRDRYFHFVFNPTPASFSDGRKGFITDPLDPGFGLEDTTWDGDWQYVARVDKEKKIWTAEVRIAFATLSAPAPTAGTKWTMNIGREHYYGPADPELSLWSPNVEERRFSAPGAFGSLIFE